MPVSSPPSPLQADPRLRNQGFDGLPEGARSTDSMTGTNIKSEHPNKDDLLKPFTELWSLDQIEAFFVGHGFKDEVDYVKSADLQDDKLEKLNAGLATATPLESFSLKMGLRVLELIKALRKLESAGGNTGGNTDGGTSWGGGGGGSSTSYGSTSYTGGGNSSFDFGSGGGRRGGGAGGGSRACFKCGEEGHMSRECPQQSAGGRGGGGSRACFKCGEEGHMSRECPSASSGGGRGGGGSRACFKCGEEGHMSRECPQQSAGGRGGGGGYNSGGRGGGYNSGGGGYNSGGGGGGYNSGGGGGGYNSGGGDSGWGGKRENDGGDNGPSNFKRPRQSEGWNSAPTAAAPVEDSWD